jgi:hypothetical protein
LPAKPCSHASRAGAVEIEVLRGQGAGAERLYAARDLLHTPIAAEWGVHVGAAGAVPSLRPYECRFRVGGATVATVPFSIEP